MKSLVLFGILLISSITYSQDAIKGRLSEPEIKNNCVSKLERESIINRLHENIKEYGLENKRRSNINRSVPLLKWPLRMKENDLFNNYYAINNYVDHDLTIGSGAYNQFGSSNTDYNCGNRTYDTDSGYNHPGTDIDLWPFKWYMVENDLVEVIASASGTIIDIDDGNPSMNCSCSGSWNAIYIMHDDGSIAWDGHMKSNSFTSKSVGEKVTQGEFLGIVASSGCSSDPHLHFEVYDSNNNLVDPFFGSCNSLNDQSLWEDQEPYINPTLNALITHGDVPSVSCENEATNFKSKFDLGEEIIIAIYFNTKPIGK